MFGLLSLGFTLSLDNFRHSPSGAGGASPTLLQWVRDVRLFGVWDGVAPAIGIILGHFLSDKISATADTTAMIGLGGVRPVPHRPGPWCHPSARIPNLNWARRGLPLPLSVDNVARRHGPRHHRLLTLARAHPVRGHDVPDVDRRAPDSAAQWRTSSTSSPASTPTC